MSTTAEVMENYSICLDEASATSSSTSDAIKAFETSVTSSPTSEDNLNTARGELMTNFNGKVFFPSDSNDNTYDEFSSPSFGNESFTGKDNLHAVIDTSLAIVLEKLDELQTSLNTEKEKNIILNNQLKKLESKINNNFRNFEHDIDDLYKGLNNVDFKTTQLDQYTRRESLVISGIPESISQNDLELTVLDILRSIGVNITSYEITACHRLFNKNNRYPPRTIIRFVNRKVVELSVLTIATDFLIPDKNLE